MYYVMFNHGQLCIYEQWFLANNHHFRPIRLLIIKDGEIHSWIAFLFPVGEGGGEGVYSRVGRFFILNICRLFEVALGTVRNFFLNWVWSKKLGELSLYRSLFFQNIRKSTNRPTLHSVQCTFMYNYIILLFLSYLHKCFLHFIRQTKQT